MADYSTETITLRKTILIDIDGTIFKHNQNLSKMATDKQELIKGTIEKFLEWRAKQYYIVITTARVEGLRKLTDAGLFYDQMIMGLPNGCRVLINDDKPDGTITSVSYCIKRDAGISNIDE